jgi:hypothetical protein
MLSVSSLILAYGAKHEAFKQIERTGGSGHFQKWCLRHGYIYYRCRFCLQEFGANREMNQFCCAFCGQLQARRDMPIE